MIYNLSFDINSIVIGIPRDHSITGELTATVTKDGNCKFEFSSLFANVIKRSSRNIGASTFGRKKATFELSYFKWSFLTKKKIVLGA
jgi:hypothetical protein